MFKFIHGNEAFLSLRAAHKIIEELKANQTDASFYSIDAESSTAEDIARIYKSHSLFSTGKIIFIKRLYKNKQKEILIPDLIEQLELDDPNFHFIIWEDEKIASNTKYNKFFTSKKCIEEFEKLNKRTFITWASKFVNEFEMDIDKESLYIFSQKCNFDPERFYNELNKLKAEG